MLAMADYACSVAQIYECTPGGCQPVTAEQANLPPTITLNVRERRLSSGLFGGEGLFSPGDVYEDPNVLILHDRGPRQEAVSPATGQMSMSIANLGRTYGQFGSCTAQHSRRSGNSRLI